MPTQKTTFEAIGTKWSIEAICAKPDWQDLLKKVHARVDKFDKTFSRFKPDSLVCQISRKPGEYALPTDGFELLDFYEKLYRATGGKLTPLIGQAIADAGYDADYSLKSEPLQQPPPWDEVLKYDRKNIELTKPALLDFGAAGKGYLVDIVAGIISGTGIKDFVINAGGDILHHGRRGINVGLENPLDNSQVVGVAKLANMSLCASAGSKRSWGRFNHILDPDLLESPKNTLATWAVAADTMTADGLATALFFVTPEKLNQFDFAYAILSSDMSINYSSDFPAKFFKN